jgi:hypothetical protein
MPKKRQPPLTTPRAAKSLIDLTCASMTATSRFEDRFWEKRLEQAIHKHLGAGHDDVIEAALNKLSDGQGDEADTLLEHVQAASQSYTTQDSNGTHQILLVTAPLAVWTRYQLPQVKLSRADLDELIDALQQTVLAPNVSLSAMPNLLGLDEMPRTFSEIHQWLSRLGARALKGRGVMPSSISIEINPALLVDTRHLIFAATVPIDEPLFRWQSDGASDHEPYLNAWTERSQSLFARLLPGCQFQILLPQPYHSGVELSERHVRLVAIQSACQWLQGALNLKPGELHATIAAVGEHATEEYRVGYHRGREQDVIYGTIWPMFDQPLHSEPEPIVNTVDEIVALLKSHGVSQIKRIPGILTPESCEDCGAPYFPNQDGELVHVELPEEAFEAPQHFH